VERRTHGKRKRRKGKLSRVEANMLFPAMQQEYSKTIL
jgi:hypothetical protein